MNMQKINHLTHPTRVSCWGLGLLVEHLPTWVRSWYSVSGTTNRNHFLPAPNQLKPKTKPAGSLEHCLVVSKLNSGHSLLERYSAIKKNQYVIFFLDLIFNYVYVCVCVSVCVCMWVRAMSKVNGMWSSWSWSYGKLWATQYGCWGLNSSPLQ